MKQVPKIRLTLEYSNKITKLSLFRHSKDLIKEGLRVVTK